MAIPQAEFKRRRRHLLATLPRDTVVLLPAAKELLRSRDTEFPFRQDSDFFYLSGFNEPDALLVLTNRKGRRYAELFCRERDATLEIWHGRRAGPAGAVRDFGMDAAYPLAQLDERLPDLFAGAARIAYPMGRDPAFDQRVLGWIAALRAQRRSGVAIPAELIDICPTLHEQRLRKSAAELALMRRAAEITAAAHVRAMRYCRAGVIEQQLAGEIHHEFLMSGAVGPAYNSIVGSGANACILHYVENSARLRAEDLVLIDAGCEYQFYAADVTRTFPVSGRFSATQRAIYELVLAAQRAALATIAPGRRWHEAQEATVRTLTKGLVRLGLLQGRVPALIKSGAYRDFYMHRVGHWLGMDVHDVGDYQPGGEWRVLEPGMVLTVEPGLYIAPDNAQVEPHWRGIGVRIEDDVVVTETGYEVLTAAVPKDIAAIEALMCAARAP